MKNRRVKRDSKDLRTHCFFSEILRGAARTVAPSLPEYSPVVGEKLQFSPSTRPPPVRTKGRLLFTVYKHFYGIPVAYNFYPSRISNVIFSDICISTVLHTPELPHFSPSFLPLMSFFLFFKMRFKGMDEIYKRGEIKFSFFDQLVGRIIIKF